MTPSTWFSRVRANALRVLLPSLWLVIGFTAGADASAALNHVPDSLCRLTWMRPYMGLGSEALVVKLVGFPGRHPDYSPVQIDDFAWASEGANNQIWLVPTLAGHAPRMIGPPTVRKRDAMHGILPALGKNLPHSSLVFDDTGACEVGQCAHAAASPAPQQNLPRSTSRHVSLRAGLYGRSRREESLDRAGQGRRRRTGHRGRRMERPGAQDVESAGRGHQHPDGARSLAFGHQELVLRSECHLVGDRGQERSRRFLSISVDQASAATSESAREFEEGINRLGGDYTSLASASSNDCLAACRNAVSGQCKAWTFVSSTPTGPNCFLKDRVPPASASDYCVSGVVPSGSSNSGSRRVRVYP